MMLTMKPIIARTLCALGLHDEHLFGSLRRKCSRCKAVWYTDYFASRAAMSIIRYKVIDRHGNDLPEMKNWKRHELDMPENTDA